MQDLVIGLSSPLDVAIDTRAGKLYWSDSGTRKIQRANLDGSDVQDVIGGLTELNGLDVMECPVDVAPVSWSVVKRLYR